MNISVGWLQALLLAACCSITAAQADTAWDEEVAGDLSNSGLATTNVAMAPGSNIVLGTTGNDGQGVDRDYFTFTVPAGSTLEAINLLGSTAVSGGQSFIALQPGPQVTVTTTGGGREALIALGHYSNDQIGTNLLPTIRVGGTGPLPSGTYSVWIQETGGPASYGMDFVISAGSGEVPALPGPALLVLGAALAVVLGRVQASRAAASGSR